MCDNAVAPSVSPLDLIAAAPSDAHVLGMEAGISTDAGQSVRWNVERAEHAELRGDFLEINALGAGVLCVHREVWEKIPGPWFRWITSDDELLSPNGGVGEDIFFCRLVRQRGFHVYIHARAFASHMRTVDLTSLAVRG